MLYLRWPARKIRLPEKAEWAAGLLFGFLGGSMFSSLLLTLASFQSQTDDAGLRAQNSVVIARLQIALGIEQGKVYQALGALQVLEQQRKDATGADAAELGEKIRDARMMRDRSKVQAKCLQDLITHADKWLGKPKK